MSKRTVLLGVALLALVAIGYFAITGPPAVDEGEADATVGAITEATMVACDLTGNHLLGRNVLWLVPAAAGKPGHEVEWLSESRFQAELAKARNAAVAAALRKAEPSGE